MVAKVRQRLLVRFWKSNSIRLKSQIGL